MKDESMEELDPEIICSEGVRETLGAMLTKL